MSVILIINFLKDNTYVIYDLSEKKSGKVGRYIMRDNLLANTLKQDAIDKFLPQVAKKLGRIFRDITFSLKPFFCVKKLHGKSDNPDTINIVKEYADFFMLLCFFYARSQQ